MPKNGFSKFRRGGGFSGRDVGTGVLNSLEYASGITPKVPTCEFQLCVVKVPGYPRTDVISAIDNHQWPVAKNGPW